MSYRVAYNIHYLVASFVGLGALIKSDEYMFAFAAVQAVLTVAVAIRAQGE